MKKALLSLAAVALATGAYAQGIGETVDATGIFTEYNYTEVAWNEAQITYNGFGTFTINPVLRYSEELGSTPVSYVTTLGASSNSNGYATYGKNMTPNQTVDDVKIYANKGWYYEENDEEIVVDKIQFASGYQDTRSYVSGNYAYITALIYYTNLQIPTWVDLNADVEGAEEDWVLEMVTQPGQWMGDLSWEIDNWTEKTPFALSSGTVNEETKEVSYSLLNNLLGDITTNDVNSFSFDGFMTVADLNFSINTEARGEYDYAFAFEGMTPDENGIIDLSGAGTGLFYTAFGKNVNVSALKIDTKASGLFPYVDEESNTVKWQWVIACLNGSSATPYKAVWTTEPMEIEGIVNPEPADRGQEWEVSYVNGMGKDTYLNSVYSFLTLDEATKVYTIENFANTGSDLQFTISEKTGEDGYHFLNIVSPTEDLTYVANFEQAAEYKLLNAENEGVTANFTAASGSAATVPNVVVSSDYTYEGGLWTSSCLYQNEEDNSWWVYFEIYAENGDATGLGNRGGGERTVYIESKLAEAPVFVAEGPEMPELPAKVDIEVWCYLDETQEELCEVGVTNNYFDSPEANTYTLYNFLQDGFNLSWNVVNELDEYGDYPLEFPGYEVYEDAITIYGPNGTDFTGSLTMIRLDEDGNPILDENQQPETETCEIFNPIIYLGGYTYLYIDEETGAWGWNIALYPNSNNLNQYCELYFETQAYELPETNAVRVIENAVEANGQVEYYNLQGIRVENPQGLVIRRQGGKAVKVVVK